MSEATEKHNRPCSERIGEELASTLETVRKLWALYKDDPEDGDEEYGRFEEYGLGFDYIEPETFTDQDEGYFRWQLSWGGPSEEFRFYVNPDKSVHRIEYRFMDWFDGAGQILTAETKALLKEIWQCYFQEFAEIPSD